MHLKSKLGEYLRPSGSPFAPEADLTNYDPFGRATGEARASMRRMAEALVVRAEETYVEPFNIAGTFARAELADETLYWLERAVDNGSFEMHYIVFWPHLDFLRNDDRYQDLMGRVYGHRARDIQKLAITSH